MCLLADVFHVPKPLESLSAVLPLYTVYSNCPSHFLVMGSWGSATRKDTLGWFVSQTVKFRTAVSALGVWIYKFLWFRGEIKGEGSFRTDVFVNPCYCSRTKNEETKLNILNKKIRAKKQWEKHYSHHVHNGQHQPGSGPWSSCQF